MKKYALLFALYLIILSCEKKQDLPESKVDFKIGYLADFGTGVHVEDFINQDTIFKNDLDTAITIQISEDDLEAYDLDPLIFENLEFTIYVNTSYDNQRFTRGNNVYSIGAGGGSNNFGKVSSISNSFVIPIKMTDNVISNNNKIELSPKNDYIRISYESKYSKLSKVKTIVIKN